MLTAEALPVLQAACHKPFRELFEGHPADLTTNKGHAGQLLERYVGLSLGNQLIDFDDGELKTNKTKPGGDPIETIAVTQIRGIIATLLRDPPLPFADSSLSKKLDNLIVVPVVKEGTCADWYLLGVYHINLNESPRLRSQFAEDYASICYEVRKNISEGGRLSTTNGHYLQIRTKDSKPYRPIYSEIFNRTVSNKNYAFYLQKAFMRDIVAGTCR